MPSLGKRYFQNHLQPKHEFVPELFLEMGVQISNYTAMHIHFCMHASTHLPAPTHTEFSDMKKSDDALLLIISLCMRIDWVP